MSEGYAQIDDLSPAVHVRVSPAAVVASWGCHGALVNNFTMQNRNTYARAWREWETHFTLFETLKAYIGAGYMKVEGIQNLKAGTLEHLSILERLRKWETEKIIDSMPDSCIKGLVDSLDCYSIVMFCPAMNYKTDGRRGANKDSPETYITSRVIEYIAKEGRGLLVGGPLSLNQNYVTPGEQSFVQGFFYYPNPSKTLPILETSVVTGSTPTPTVAEWEAEQGKRWLTKAWSWAKIWNGRTPLFKLV